MKMRWLFLILLTSLFAQGVLLGAQQNTLPVAQPTDHPLRASGPAPGMRIGGQQAVYPLEARAAGIEGSVLLKVAITAEGKTDNVQVLSGPQELRKAAVDAAKTWTYHPYLSSGHPIAKEITQPVNFHLGNTPAEKADAQADAQAKLKQATTQDPKTKE